MDGVKLYHLRLIEDERLPFEVPSMDEFLSYPYDTILDLDEGSRKDFKSRVTGKAKNTVEAYRNKRHPFAAELQSKGVKLPPQRNKITVSLAYQAVSDFPADTAFQDFYPAGRFEQKQAMMSSLYYPVSAQKEHMLDADSWNFVQAPVFWDSWSQFGTMALNKMAGNRSYEDAAKIYSFDIEDILRHATNAERGVIDILSVMKTGENPRISAERVNCPPEYIGVYLSKILRTISWFCNSDSLRDPQKLQYLQNISAACAEHGLRITPEELASLRFNTKI